MKHGRGKGVAPTTVDDAKVSVPPLALPLIAPVLGKMFFGATAKAQSLPRAIALSVLQEMNQTLVSSEIISSSLRSN